MKKTLITGFLLLSMLMGATNVFAASYLGTGDNVDSGGHLDWDYDTTYYSQTVWGMKLWNGYKSGIIREDSPTVIEDIFVTDIDSSTAGYYGYGDRANAKIYFNIYSMEDLGANEKKICCCS